MRAVRPRVWQVAAAGLLVAVAAWADPTSSTSGSAEYAIKAAFLCKFGNYVEWPERLPVPSEVPFEIGVVGSDSVVDQLKRAALGQTVNARRIVVRRLAADDPVTGLGIVFVARSGVAYLARTLATTKGRPILTVTESEEGIALGSVVNFVVIADKVKFDVALKPAEQNNLKISARLLGVARVVTGMVLQ
jgi:hypothetical protein